MKFNYQARDKKGEVRSGVVEASTEETALQILDRHGLYVTILEQAQKAPILGKRIELFSRISRKDVMVFSRQLAIMFRSQVPLVEALQTIAMQLENEAFRERLQKVSEDVEAGTPLSDALSRHTDAFSSFYINMVKSGEVSGTLSDVLGYLADHEEREYDLQSKIKGAFVYPAFVVFIAGAVLFLMMFYVIPNISKIISETGAELPPITRVVMALSAFVRAWWWLLFLGLGGSIVSFLRYLKTSGGKRFWGIYSLKIPMFGSFLRMIYLTRFAENLATLVAGGIPIVQALEITGRIIGNVKYESIVEEAKEGVRRGERISSVLRQYPAEFPPVFTQMMFVGEKSGSLDKVLENVVSFYQKEVERSIEGFLGVLEPALIVVLGLVVGGLMVSVLMPLYQSLSF
ncbi:MAG: type II secretion system F family protein [Patescibacteria group bacterium]